MSSSRAPSHATLSQRSFYALLFELLLGDPELVFKCIQENEIDNRRSLYQHIVLSGGNSMYAGFPSRLERDIKRLHLKNVLNGDKEAMKKFKMKVEAPKHRKHMVFVGGAVLADIMRSKDEF